MMRKRFPVILVLLCLFGALCASDAHAKQSLAVPLERPTRTYGSDRIDGRDIAYTATAGTLTLHDDRGRPTANMFYIAYIERGSSSLDRRPITFAYNGGPGVSSTSLNIGAFGPKIVAGVTIDRVDGPANVVDNPTSLLAKTDLVFIDAVGTGFSHAVGPSAGKDFYGVEEDTDAFTQFIRRYTMTNGRANSPKYLLGLSYGTMRSAVVAQKLELAGVYVSGIVSMSTVLDFPAIAGGGGQDTRYWLYVPTEAMIASYHGKNGSSFSDTSRSLPEMRTFAAGPYAHALDEGDALASDERLAIAQQLHTYIGLPVADIMSADLRVTPELFEATLLKSERKTMGRYDARVLQDVDSSGKPADGDPSAVSEAAAIAAAMPKYLHDTLRYARRERYVLVSSDVNQSWNWGEGGPAGTNVTDDLADAMARDPGLRVLSLNGYYDLATPFFGSEYQLTHLGTAAKSHDRIQFRYYESGHMIFVDAKARAAMKTDLDAFYDAGQQS